MNIAQRLLDVFINRTIVHRYCHHIGVVTYSNHAVLDRPISGDLDYFELSCTDETIADNRPFREALRLAVSKLSDYGNLYPRVTKRLIVFMDPTCMIGGDTTYYDLADFMLSLLQARSLILKTNVHENSKIIFDHIRLPGDYPNYYCGFAAVSHLYTLGDNCPNSIRTNGYAFWPRSLVEAVSVCELDTVLCCDERPAFLWPRCGCAIGRPTQTTR